MNGSNVPTCPALTFADVVPQVADYRVVVTKELYATATQSVNVAPGAGAVP